MFPFFTHPKRTFALVICTLILLNSLSGCSAAENPQPTSQIETSATPISTEATKYLRISAVANVKAGYTSFSPEELGGNYNNTLSYLCLQNVTVTLECGTMYLEDAIREGEITVEEMLAYARIDARNGFCGTSTYTENGLTRFTYHYPDFDLWTIHDIFETPDGREQLISDFGLCAPGLDPSQFYMDEATGKPLGYEDWGITLEVTESSPSSIQVACSQTGGQQIGSLTTEFFTLYHLSPESSMEEYIQPVSGSSNAIHMPITPEGITQITIDLASCYGELPAGNYIVYLSIEDHYNQADVHPLMKNYYDEQLFDVPFSLS